MYKKNENEFFTTDNFPAEIKNNLQNCWVYIRCFLWDIYEKRCNCDKNNLDTYMLLFSLQCKIACRKEKNWNLILKYEKN